MDGRNQGKCQALARSITCAWIAALMLVVFAPIAAAQNLPPAGAYQPIPNYTGVGAGLLFRNAINDRFGGEQPISPTIVSLAFASLPSETDGALIYCNDCQRTVPCASGGSGAWAFGAQGQWECTAPGRAASGANSDITSLLAVSSGSETGMQNANNGVINVQANLNLLCTAASTPYSFCTGSHTGTFTPAKGDGTTDDTTAIQDAVTAACVKPGTEVLFPAVPAGDCYKFSSITVPCVERLIGQGWSSDQDGIPSFTSSGFLTHIHGSVLCSTIRTGVAVDLEGATITGGANGAQVSDLFVAGPGSNGTALSITSCTQSGTTPYAATCTVADASTVPVGTPIYIAGNSIANYNGFFFVTAQTSTTFSYLLNNNNVTGLGTGTGGTVTPTSVGVSIGDQTHYGTSVFSSRLGVGNFGTNMTVHAQNSRFYATLLEDAYADNLYDEIGTSNNDLFSGLTERGGNHINIDWANSSQSDRFVGMDLEDPVTGDTTARSIYCSSCNADTFANSYIEDNAEGGYTGDDVQIDSGSNSIGTELVNLHISGGTGQNIHITGAAHTIVLGGQMSSITDDSSSQETTLVVPDVTTVTENSSTGFSFGEQGKFSGVVPQFQQGLTINDSTPQTGGTNNCSNQGTCAGEAFAGPSSTGYIHLYSGSMKVGSGSSSIPVWIDTLLQPGSGLQMPKGQVISVSGYMGATAPTATCSGGSTGVSVTGGSANNRGQMTTSSTASTNCTITWSANGTWPQAPFCVFTDGSGSTTPTAFSTGSCGTSTCTFDFASATSKVVNWVCM